MPRLVDRHQPGRDQARPPLHMDMARQKKTSSVGCMCDPRPAPISSAMPNTMLTQCDPLPLMYATPAVICWQHVCTHDREMTPTRHHQSNPTQPAVHHRRGVAMGDPQGLRAMHHQYSTPSLSKQVGCDPDPPAPSNQALPRLPITNTDQSTNSMLQHD